MKLRLTPTRINSLRSRIGHAAALAILCFAVTARAQDTVKVSLTTIIDLALRNSIPVRLAAADIQKASALVSESKQVYIPNLILGSSIGPPSYGFPVGQPSIYTVSSQSVLFSSSQKEYIRAAKFGRSSAEFTLKDAREQVILDASTDYIELDTVSREIAAADEQAKFAERLVGIEQERTDAGVDSASELLQAKLSAAQLKLRRLHLLARFGTLRQQLSSLTDLPAVVILPDPATIPEVPAIRPELRKGGVPGIDAAQQAALSNQHQTHGEAIAGFRPQVSFGFEYNRDAAFSGYTNYYRSFQQNNVSAGIQMQFPLFDPIHRSKLKESSASSLRATIQAEQAQHQNEEHIAALDGTIAELDAEAEVAGLQQQIAAEQVKTVTTELQGGNGSSSTQQLSPKAEQLARIEERQRFVESLDAGFDLTKARLSLLRAFGHMEEWLHTLSPASPPPNK
jgi:outer membrane protein TolC